MIKLRFQRNLQRVVHGATAREKHLVFAEIGVESRKRGRIANHIAVLIELCDRAREASIRHGAGIQTKASKIRDRCTGIDGASDRSRVKTGSASERTIGRGDGCLSVSDV